MSRQLYVVEILFKTVVLAENEEEAEAIAEENKHEMLEDDFPAFSASPMKSIPSTWNLKALPWQDMYEGDEDITVDNLIALGHAPEYKKKKMENKIKKAKESKDVTRGQLIYMVAILRGALSDGEYSEEKQIIIDKTSFDISDEDVPAYDEAKESEWLETVDEEAIRAGEEADAEKEAGTLLPL